MVASAQAAASINNIQVSTPPDDTAHNAHKIKSACINIHGIATQFVMQPFSDRVFVIVTQVGKLGTLLAASVDVQINGDEMFSVDVLMGQRDVPEMQMCARTIMGLIKADGSDKALLLSLALKDHSIQTIRAVIEQVNQLRVW